MKPILAFACSLVLAGCFVQTRPVAVGRRGEGRRACPPAHHWDDGRCVHNGRARGHDRDDDHDRGHGQGHGHDHHD